MCQAAPVHPTLALTGERTLPGIPAENYWFFGVRAVFSRK
jgi:hypothetical protein